MIEELHDLSYKIVEVRIYQTQIGQPIAGSNKAAP